MTTRRQRAWVWTCRCERCGHEWRVINGGEPPARCPRCKSRYWQHPPGTLKRGRPKKKAAK